MQRAAAALSQLNGRADHTSPNGLPADGGTEDQLDLDGASASRAGLACAWTAADHRDPLGESRSRRNGQAVLC